MEGVVLSARLKALADMVTPGKTVVDVGCDHGFVSIYLVQQGISPSVLAMDVRTGPLSRAQEHITAYGLENYIDTRLSDGLCEYREGEAQSLVCAGMGGRLMTRILTESRTKAQALEELILQPQSEIPEFRGFLRREGYDLLEENILCEDGKYYFLMKVSHSAGRTQERRLDTVQEVGASRDSAAMQELYEQFGELLLKRRHPVLKEYLEQNLKNLEQITGTLVHNERERARKRLSELEIQMERFKRALALWDLEAENEQ